MRKYGLIGLLLLLCITGCSKKETAEFRGVIIAVESQRVLVRSDENPDTYYDVPLMKMAEYDCVNVAINDALIVTYDGVIVETNPPQFQGIENIELIMKQ